MANKISDETIEYVGILAKLELTDEEKEAAKSDMEKMLDYIDTLNELDTAGIEPMSHVFPVSNVFREDVVTKTHWQMRPSARTTVLKCRGRLGRDGKGGEHDGYFETYSTGTW